VEIDVEAFNLDGLVDPEAHEGLHHHQDHEGGDGAPDDGGDDAVDLQPTTGGGSCPAVVVERDEAGRPDPSSDAS